MATLKAGGSVGYDWPTITRSVPFDQHPIARSRLFLDAGVTVKPSEFRVGETVAVRMFDYPPGPATAIRLGSVTLPEEYARDAGTVPDSWEHKFPLKIPGRAGDTPGQGPAGGHRNGQR